MVDRVGLPEMMRVKNIKEVRQQAQQVQVLARP